MPETRSTFDASKCLEGIDGDLSGEYNDFIDVAEAARDKYAKLIAVAKKLKETLDSKQSEFDRQINRLSRDLENQKDSAVTARDKLQATNVRLRKFKGKTESLRRDKKHLAEELQAANAKLEHVKDLRCGICMDNIINAFTTCGHGYCSDCMMIVVPGWNPNNKDATDSVAELPATLAQSHAIPLGQRSVMVMSDSLVRVDTDIAYWMELARNERSVYWRDKWEEKAQNAAIDEGRPIPRLSRHEKVAVAERNIADLMEMAGNKDGEFGHNIWEKLAQNIAVKEGFPTPRLSQYTRAPMEIDREEKFDSDPPDCLVDDCISLDLIHEAVMVPSGRSYDRLVIERWINDHGAD
ncbi:hypothetical protein DV736_g952, partial [Chaetothyriales sp. CBS 134916]